MRADTAGGLATAAFELTGISDRLGPVAGDLGALANGQFDPASVLDAESVLLGTVSLAQLIRPATAAQFGDRLPTMRTEVERSPSGQPQAVIGRLRWSPEVHSVGPFKAALNGQLATLTIDAKYRQLLTGEPPDYQVTGVLSHFQIDFFGVVAVNFQRLEFRSVTGEKVDVNPVLDPDPPVEFKGALAFLDRLREYIPANGFSGARPGLEAANDGARAVVVPRAVALGPGSGPAVEVTQRGVEVSYSLGLPPLAFGAFTLQNVTLGAGLSLPFVAEPARLRFHFAERHSPFQLTALALGGGGFVALEVALDRVVGLEAALEFGAAAALNLGVARGSVHMMGGIYFALRAGVAGEQSETELTGYLRSGGELRVLGLVSISVEFYMELSYRSSTNEVRGQATVTVGVSVAFFRKKVSLTLERRFAGPGGVAEALLAGVGGLIAADQGPTFGDGMDEDDWRAYVTAFA